MVVPEELRSVHLSIGAMTREQLATCDGLIAKRKEVLDRSMALKLEKGQEVFFRTAKGDHVYGTVKSVLKKDVLVMPKSGVHEWKVPAAMLTVID